MSQGVTDKKEWGDTWHLTGHQPQPEAERPRLPMGFHTFAAVGWDLDFFFLSVIVAIANHGLAMEP